MLGDLPDGVRLVAISKYHPNEYIMAAYEEGRVFGESHEQELRQKVESLPKDIEWHFIGHLQTNKVKYIAPYIQMVEAVDSLKLLREINKQAAKHERTIKVLLELHIAEEETKVRPYARCLPPTVGGRRMARTEERADLRADDDGFVCG